MAFDLLVVAINRSGADAAKRGATLFRRDGEPELFDMETDGARIRLNRSVLFKIHGYIDRTSEIDDTFVITEEDHVSFLCRMGSGESILPADLVTMMQSRTLLFLGHGLRDWNFRVLLDRLSRSSLQQKRSYAVAYDIDDAESKLWGVRKVAVLAADLNKFVPRLDAALALPPPST